MERRPAVISVMVAVSDAPKAVAWYKHSLGAVELWSLGSVAGLEIAGAPFFVGEPANNGWECPVKLGIPSARIEVFCDDPDAFIARAVEAVQTGAGTRSGITRCRGDSIDRAGSSIPSGTSGWSVTDHP